jgi:CheY-like chemotaxis protein
LENIILIVEDNENIRKLVRLTLSGIGNFKILEAISGNHAIKIVEQEKPNLIFMDIMISGNLDGLEVTREFKGNKDTANIPIIMLTAKGQKADIEKGMEVGADDYFVKPFSPTALIKITEKYLEIK